MGVDMGANAAPSPPLTSSPLPSEDVFLGETPRVVRVSGSGTGEAAKGNTKTGTDANTNANMNTKKDEEDAGGNHGTLPLSPLPTFAIVAALAGESRSRQSAWFRTIKSSSFLIYHKFHFDILSSLDHEDSGVPL